jgi:hypothetical protein
MDFNLANNRTYPLARTTAASARLNYQFYLWKDSLGFNLHPTIAASLETQTQNQLCIADICTGTAIWLFNLLSSLPATASMSLSLTPPTPWLPANLTLRE